MESLPLLRANFYSMLMEGRIREEEISGYLEDYQLSFSGTVFVLYCRAYFGQPDTGGDESGTSNDISQEAGGGASGRKMEGKGVSLS